MKTLFIIVLLASTFPLWGNSHNADSRSNGLLKFVASYPGLRDVALYSLLANRCNRYMAYEHRADCRQAVAAELRLLDFDMIFDDKKSMGPQDFIFVAFKTDLIELLARPSTTVFLNDLQKNLQLYFQQEIDQFNIWELALTHYKKPIEAAKVIAVLFQDTSLAKLHISYLERTQAKGKNNFEQNKLLLSKSIDTINLILDHAESSYQELFYPPSVQKSFNRNIYHFYVPLYLSMALERDGIKKRFAYAAPLILTLTYEFVTTANDFRYLYWDPTRIDPIKNIWKLKDIYGGYSGVSFSVKKATLSLDIIKETFARSTEDAVSLLLDH